MNHYQVDVKMIVYNLFYYSFLISSLTWSGAKIPVKIILSPKVFEIGYAGYDVEIFVKTPRKILY